MHARPAARARAPASLLPAAAPPLPHPRRDYRRIEHLDAYEQEGIDEDVEDDMDEEQRFAARQAAEAQLARRDRREGMRTGRALPAALAGGGGEARAGAAAVRGCRLNF